MLKSRCLQVYSVDLPLSRQIDFPVQNIVFYSRFIWHIQLFSYDIAVCHNAHYYTYINPNSRTIQKGNYKLSWYLSEKLLLKLHTSMASQLIFSAGLLVLFYSPENVPFPLGVIHKNGSYYPQPAEIVLRFLVLSLQKLIRNNWYKYKSMFNPLFWVDMYTGVMYWCIQTVFLNHKLWHCHFFRFEIVFFVSNEVSSGWRVIQQYIV